MALRACGRFKVTVATLSATSTFMHSYLAYWDTFSSVVIIVRAWIEPPSHLPLLSAHSGLHLRQRDMKRHRTGILLQHPLHGFQMGTHQARRVATFRSPSAARNCRRFSASRAIATPLDDTLA